jgi:hypothetical protein
VTPSFTVYNMTKNFFAGRCPRGQIELTVLFPLTPIK